MSYRFEVLLSTLEHIQLTFETNKKFCAASIRLDSQNLTRDEIILLRDKLRLTPLEEWYPKAMREIVLWEGFAPINNVAEVQRIQKNFSSRYAAITRHELDPVWWTDKLARPKYNGKHAKAWASETVTKMQQSLQSASN